MSIVKSPQEPLNPSPVAINLKLYGLPRTGTNWVAYNVMKTFPQVRVWHSSGPEEESHQKQEFWKHGYIQPVKGMDGYIFCVADLKHWSAAMDRYDLNNSHFDRRYAFLLYHGWMECKRAFEDENSSMTSIFRFNNHPKGEYRRANMLTLLKTIRYEFDLALIEHEYHIESKQLRRNSDLTKLEHYLSEHEYSYNS